MTRIWRRVVRMNTARTRMTLAAEVGRYFDAASQGRWANREKVRRNVRCHLLVQKSAREEEAKGKSNMGGHASGFAPREMKRMASMSCGRAMPR